MKKVIFVCSGNTCRSAMAEKILKKQLKLLQVTSFSVTSYGLNVTESEMNSLAKAALKKIGIAAGRFTPKQLDQKAIKNKDAIICMTESIRTAVAEKLNRSTNLYSTELFGYGDIPDPYGLGEAEYEAVANTLLKLCKEMAIFLKKELEATNKGENLQ